MNRVVVSLFLVYYSIGTLLFPMGDLSYLRDLPQMYRHCATEDPDINLCDFVVEHLMNIQDHDEQEREHDKPHQPVYSHSPVQLMATCSQQLIWLRQTTESHYMRVGYPITQHSDFNDAYLANVFRPPIAAA